MPSPKVSKWCIPYFSLLSLLTGVQTKFTTKIYEMRYLLRIGFLDIFSSLLQATIIGGFIKGLQTISQTAYMLLQKSQNINLLWTQFYTQILTYAIALHVIALFDLCIRYYRNHYFTHLAKRLTSLTKRSTTKHTFTSKYAKNSVNTDRQATKLTDILKSYYMVCQSIIMAPIELMTYLYTLGPTLLLTITILSFAAGCVKKAIASLSQALRNPLLDAQDKANNSVHKNHDVLTHNLLNIENENKYYSMAGDYLDVFVRSSFQVMVMFVCGYFVFTGSYSLAMMSAQTAAAPAALSRISKYLDLLKTHIDFDSSIQDRFDIISLKPYKGTNIPKDSNPMHVINEVEAHRTFIELKQLSLTINNAKLTEKVNAILNNTKCKLDIKLKESDDTYLLATRALKDLKDSMKSKTAKTSVNNIVTTSLNEYYDHLKDAEVFNALLTQEKMEKYLTQQQELQESLYSTYPHYNTPYLCLFAACPLIILGLIFTPFPSLAFSKALLPTITFYPKFGLGLISFLGLAKLAHKTTIQDVGSTTLAYCLKLALLFSATCFAVQLYGIASVPFLLQNSYGIAGVLAVTYPILLAVNHYCLQSLVFTFDYLGTWASQEAVFLLRQPYYQLEKLSKYLPSLQFKQSKTSHSFSAYLPRFEHFRGSFAMHL